MAAVLECAADGSFDLENVADVDLDRAPAPGAVTDLVCGERTTTSFVGIREYDAAWKVIHV